MEAQEVRTTSTTRRVFPSLNAGYNRVFHHGSLSLGLTVPVAAYGDSDVPAGPDVTGVVRRIQAVEQAGFSAIWLRDVPFRVPSFGDAGHVTDPWVTLGLLAGQTSRIALGVASGDRPAEYPAMNQSFADRGARFREAYAFIRHMAEPWADFDSAFGSPRGMDLLPKPVGPRLPLLITGGSQQSPDWLAANGDGWMTYPRDLATQARFVAETRSRSRDLGFEDRPVMQPLYVDLLDDPDARPQPIHLGLRTGVKYLRAHLQALQALGINHVAINLRFQHGDVEHALDRLATTLLPDFPA